MTYSGAMQIDDAWLLAFLAHHGVPLEVAARFVAKVQLPTRESGCWIWTAARGPRGHGVFWDGKVSRGAHRHLYQWVHGPVGSLDVDHKMCQNPPCVNPSHMEAVPHAVNIRRGNLPQYSQTHCKRGHEFTKENTGWYKQPRNGRPMRQCKECQRIRQRGYRASSKVASP